MSPRAYLSTVLFIFVARVLVVGGASVLVLDLVLAAGVVEFGAECAAATLRCLRFFRLKVLVLVLCVGGALVGFSVGLENARPICCLASSSECAIDRVSCWAVSVLCTLGTEWVIVGIVMCTLGTDGVVLSGVANDLTMAGCWWMACSESSTKLPHLLCAIGAGDVFDCFCTVCDRIHDLICMGDGWSCDMFVTEVDCVRDPFTFGCFNVTSVRAIMFVGS